LYYSYARHGTDYDYRELEQTTGSSGLKFMENVHWKESEIEFSAKYEVVNNAYFYLKFRYSNVSGDKSYVEKYTPEYYWGKTNTFTFGANIGF